MKNARRIEIGIAVLVLFGLMSNVSSVHDAALTLRRLPSDSDMVTQFGVHIASIRRDLPDHGMVGFVSEPPEDMTVNPVYTREWVWLRYFLAPLLVIPYVPQRAWKGDEDPVPYTPLVIGSFHGASPGRLLDEHGLVIVKDYGNGIMLLRPR
jgi:hypothetical protein